MDLDIFMQLEKTASKQVHQQGEEGNGEKIRIQGLMDTLGSAYSCHRTC